MSFNKFMHPRNIYRNPPNFKELSIKYPEFRQFAIQDLAGKIRIDFKDPNALRMLTTILLKNDFQLSVEIPPDHLIPTLPQRLNYILWIEDLLESFPKQKDDIIGIDIGTGACCIYPLLGCKVKSWKFLATEINEESFDWAIKNINANNMQNQIKVIKVNSNNILQDVISNEEICFDFTMCNPPFFNDQNDMSVKISRTPRRSLPKSINTPSETEKSTEGGEIEFIKKMIDESFLLKEKVRIFTTMIGKKQSFQVIKSELKKNNIIQFITCEFCQGNTMRWGIAWTFSSDVQFQKVPSLRHHKQKPPIAYLVPKSKNFKYTVESVASVITKLLEEIKVSYQTVSRSKNNIHLCLKAKENTWSHQRRKRRQLLRQQKIKENSSSCSDKLEDSTTIENSVDEKDEVPMETEDSCINKCIEDIEIEENINTDKTNEDEVSLKRERTSSDSFEEIEPKRVKLETNYDENCESFADYSDYDMDDIKEKSDQYVLYCDLSVKRGGRNIFLNLQCSSEMNREPMHQVLQYFKNKLM